jgi:NTE family protein
VLEVLEAEGIRPAFLSGTSMGGLVAAMWATASSADDIIAAARRFRFPGRFMPGRGSLGKRSSVGRRTCGAFEDPDAAGGFGVDLMTGEEIALHSGPLLPAVRSTCAVPGVFAPEQIGTHCLVDGGVTNMLPVDLAWACDPDIVIAVNIVASPPPTLRLNSAYGRAATALGKVVPNPMTAYLAYEIAMRAVEIALDRQRAMAVAMTGPEVLIDIDLSHVSISDFDRLDEIVEAGRQATRLGLSRLRAALTTQVAAGDRSSAGARLHIDPVCRMTVSPGRARAIFERGGETYYFCSLSCRDTFALHGDRYITDNSTRAPILRIR